MHIEKGDWVCFMSDGKLVIGQVEYKKTTVLGWSNVYTSVGMVHEESILEVRPPIEEVGTEF